MITSTERDAAIAACRKAGVDPFEVVPVGPCTAWRGDRLVDGPEAERWMLELGPDHLRRIGLS